MPEDEPIPPLRSINGYEILELIAAGGMSRVYRASNAAGESVAVKVIQFDEMAADYERRLRREPEIQRGIGHDNIVRLIDWFRVGGEFFLVMEYIDGRSLWRIIREEGAMPFDRARNYLRQVLPAVGHLHDLGIIHRDIKPANILVTLDDRAKLADFGIAKFTWQQGQTSTQLGLGTPEYMSPEQARGVGIDQRSDIYSLGITFYEMLTGRPPFSSNQETPAAYSEIIQGILSRPIPDPRTVQPGVPSGAAALIARAAAKDPKDRFTTCEQMLRALDTIEAEELSPATVVLGSTGGDASTFPLPAGDGRQSAWHFSDRRDDDGVGAVKGGTHPSIRRPAVLALIVVLLAGAAFAATQLLSPSSSSVADAQLQTSRETPSEIATRVASSFGQYSRIHNLELLAALYASDRVRYLDAGMLSRDSIMGELRDDYRRLARTDSFAVTVDSTRAIGDTAIELTWRTSYRRVRTDSSRFDGSTRDRLRLVRNGARWEIGSHEQRLLAGVAPDGPLPPRATGTGSSRPRASGPSPGSNPGARRAPQDSRDPVVTVRIDRGVKVDGGNPGRGGGNDKPKKAKKRRK